MMLALLRRAWETWCILVDIYRHPEEYYNAGAFLDDVLDDKAEG